MEYSKPSGKLYAESESSDVDGKRPRRKRKIKSVERDSKRKVLKKNAKSRTTKNL